MLPKLKHRQNLKHPSTRELSGVTRLPEVQDLQESAGFEPKLGTGEGERKEQMRQAPVLHHHRTTFHPKQKQTEGKKVSQKSESPLLFKEHTRLNSRGEEKRRRGQHTNFISLREAQARQLFF